MTATRRTLGALVLVGAFVGTGLSAPAAPVSRNLEAMQLAASKTYSGSISRGTTLYASDRVVSSKSYYSLTMQSDGNLVLYKRNGLAIWSSRTNGKGGRRAVFQRDGNFVVYSSTKALWASGTNGKGGVRLTLQNDGNLVMYTSSGKAVWSTRTQQPKALSVDGFISKYRSYKSLDYDGSYGPQCVDIFKAFNVQVAHGARLGSVGAAHNIWDRFASIPTLSQTYTKVSRTATPRKGDIAVWSSSMPNSGGAGHVAVVLYRSGSTLHVFDQRPGGPIRYDHRISTGTLLGYLRAKWIG